MKVCTQAILYVTREPPCSHLRKNTPKTQPFNLHKHGRLKQAAKSSAHHQIQRLHISSLTLGVKMTTNNKRKRQTNKH